MTTFFRITELFELIVLTTCGSYLLEGYRSLMSRTVLIIGRCYVAALLIVALAVAVNALAQSRLNPGLVVAAVMLSVPAAVVAWYTWHAVRQGTFPGEPHRH